MRSLGLKLQGWGVLAIIALFFSLPASAGHLFTQATTNTPINLTAGTGLQITQVSYEPGAGSGLVTINFYQMGSTDTTLIWDAGDAIKLTIGSYSQTFAYDTLLTDATLSGASQTSMGLNATVADPTLNAALVGAATTPNQAWIVEATSGQFTFEGYRIYVAGGTFNGTGAGPINQNQVVTADQLPSVGATDIDTVAASYLASNIGVTVNPVFKGGVLQIDSDGTTFSEDFTIDDSANGATSTIDQNGNNVIFSGVFSDAAGQTGSLTIANGSTGGSVTFTGVNTYTGATTIDNGATLALSGDGSIASSSGVANNGTFDISGTTAGASVVSLSGNGTTNLGGKTLTLTNAGGTYGGVLSGTGGLTVAGGTETLSGTNTYAGATTIDNGATLALSGTGSIANSSGVVNNGTFDILGTTAGASVVSLSGNGATSLGSKTLMLTNAGSTYGGVLSGTGGLTVAGGTETLSGTNTYTGATTISNGAALALTCAGSIAASSGVANNGTFDISSCATAGTSIKSLSGNGNTTLGANTLTLINASGSYSGAFTGTGGLIVAGGTETLSGANTYTGATSINNGATLVLSGSGSIASSSGVANNGTFDISGAAAGASIASLTGNGTTNLGGKTLTLTNAGGAYTGTFSSNGGGLNIAGGAFTQGSALSNMGSISIANGATFVSSGVIGSAAVGNAGTLAVGAGNTTTITGNYTQSATGVFETRLSSATSYGKLAVNGNADISASNKINVNVIGAPSLVPGTSMPRVISATGTLTAGPTFSVTDNSALFNFTAVKNGNAVDLYILSSNITALGSVNSVHATPAVGAASVMDSFIAAGPSVPADMADVVTALGMLPTQQDVSDAVSQTLPLLTGGMDQVTSGSTHSTNRVVQARMDVNRGLSSGDDFVSNENIWLKPFYSYADQRTVGNAAGYRSDTSGIVLGADGEASAHDRVGVALSYAASSVKGKSLTANTGSVSSTQLVFYGSHALDEQTEISYQADVGTHRNDGSRQINFGGLNRVAVAAYNSTSVHLGAGVGRTLPVGEGSTFAPSVRLDYSNMHDNAYTETGAGGLNLAVQARNTESLVLSVDGRGLMSLSDQTGLSGNLGIGYDALARQSSLTSTYVGGGAAFTTMGINPSKISLTGGLGLSYTADNSSEVLLRYDLEAKERFVNQTASVKWRMPL